MKKIALSLFVALSLFSCDRDNNKELVKKEELTKNNVSFVNYRKIIDGNAKLKLLKQQGKKQSSIKESAMIDGGSVGFEFTIGRKSRGCQGFGICELTAFWIEIYGKEKDKLSESDYTGIITKTNNIIFQDNGEEYGAFLFLAEEINNEKFDTTLVIDEDIRVNNNYIVKKGLYQLDKRLGDFGGYKLDVEKL